MTADQAEPLTEGARAALGTDWYRAVNALNFMRACARGAGVPFADQWQLHYGGDDALHPWRVVDAGAVVGSGSTRNVVFVLTTARTVTGIKDELDTIGKVFRGMDELRRQGWAPDLMAEARRDAVVIEQVSTDQEAEK
jgi:hypothetical protein